MSDLRKAAEQALAFLTALDQDDNDRDFLNAPQCYDLDRAMKDLRAALAEPEQEPVCNPHPKAPHGFDRNSSHSAGRYVCDCEHWEPYDAGYQKGLQDGLERAYALQEISSIGQLQEAPPRREPEQSEPACYQYQDRDGQWCNFVSEKHYEDTKLDGNWPIRALYTAPPRREPLSDEQILSMPSLPDAKQLDWDLYGVMDDDNLRFARAIESAVRKQAGWE